MMNITITPLYAAALAIIYVLLAVLVIRQRFRCQVGLGDGQQPHLVKAIRVHGNFAEYVPLMLVLLLLLELKGCPHWQLHLIGALMVGGRILHAIGLNLTSGTSVPRFLGMIATFSALLGAAGLLLWS